MQTFKVNKALVLSWLRTAFVLKTNVCILLTGREKQNKISEE